MFETLEYMVSTFPKEFEKGYYSTEDKIEGNTLPFYIGKTIGTPFNYAADKIIYFLFDVLAEKYM